MPVALARVVLAKRARDFSLFASGLRIPAIADKVSD
jgi:hypothetical protein